MKRPADKREREKGGLTGIYWAVEDKEKDQPCRPMVSSFNSF